MNGWALGAPVCPADIILLDLAKAFDTSVLQKH